MTDFISVPFYDLFHEGGHVPRIRESLPPLLAGVRQSILEVGAGTGLIGLRERVALAGGRLEHERLPDGGFRLCATLPWPSEASA